MYLLGPELACGGGGGEAATSPSRLGSVLLGHTPDMHEYNLLMFCFSIDISLLTSLFSFVTWINTHHIN